MVNRGLSPLRVSGAHIVDNDGNQVRLRGIALGGWMNMENFINGYPGVEHSLRAAVAQVLGPETGEFFFNRMLDYVLAEEDIAYMAEIGANCVRLALNYRHFEDDARPFVYKEEGFLRLDQAIEWCAKHDVYAILDMHAVQGWQNPDWHSDNRHKHALLWHHPHFQDRYVALWEELAQRYKGNPAIAAYDVVNEPSTLDMAMQHDWPALNCVYRRIVEAIQALDPDHIIFLEGDAFASRFGGLEPPFAANVAYSSHDYNPATFGPGPYPGQMPDKYRDRSTVQAGFINHQGTRYAQEHGVPLYIGEFGAVYNGATEEIPDRLRALDDQLDAFDEFGAHWTIWTYKDVGVMGVVTLDPHSGYLQTLQVDLDAKLEIAADAWIHWLPRRAIHEHVHDLAHLIHGMIPDPPVTDVDVRAYISDTIISGYASSLMQPAWASRFANMTEEQLDDILQSFALQNCRPNEGLVEVLKKHFRKL